MARDRFSSDRYGYVGRGAGGARHVSGGHAPSNEESGNSVTRKKTPLQHLHQKAGVSTCTMYSFKVHVHMYSCMMHYIHSEKETCS